MGPESIAPVTSELGELDPADFGSTRDALHGYARVLGSWTAGLRDYRKHWWHASLRPSLNGVSTGILHAGPGFEIELDFKRSLMCVRMGSGQCLDVTLQGQRAADVANHLRSFLCANGVPGAAAGRIKPPANPHDTFSNYSPAKAGRMLGVLRAVNGALTSFRAGLREETSPIQLWPHHFDLSMLWLSGERIAGQDADDEELSDEQMNFGFTFGDEGVPEPYFYITAYPQPAGWSEQSLPGSAVWHDKTFTGVMLKYSQWREESDPQASLLRLWQGALNQRQQMCSTSVKKGEV